MLFRNIISIEVINFNNECIRSSLRDNVYTSFKQVSKISEKNLSTEEIKAPNNLVKKDVDIQKTGKGNNNVILNGSDNI